jgi:hypothetical protein
MGYLWLRSTRTFDFCITVKFLMLFFWVVVCVEGPPKDFKCID